MLQQEVQLPLEGIRVLEMSHAVMGPTTGLILADMGAEVIKIEKAPDGEDTRQLKGFGAGFFPFFNRNKKSLALNLKDEAGKKILDRLIETADVLVENFAPGTIERLGFDYERVSRINTRLVYCSLKGFMPGPYGKRPALDEVVQMMGGLAYMTGPSGRPLRSGASVVDIMGGSFGAIGILTALYEREKTGRGQLVTATLFEAVAFLVGPHMAAAAVTGQEPLPMPERGRTWSVYDLFETADGEKVFLGITSDRQWERFCQTFGYEDLCEEVRYRTNHDRIEQQKSLLPELESRLRTLTKSQVMALAEKASIPFARVARPVELFHDPHLLEAKGLLETKLPGGKRARLPKLPLRIGAHEFGLRNGPPQVGLGARDLLLSVGLELGDIERLIEQGVVGPV